MHDIVVYFSDPQYIYFPLSAITTKKIKRTKIKNEKILRFL